MFTMTWREELGDEIKKARKRNGMTQQDLADRISVKREQISNYENGNSAPPVNIFAEIASVLGTEFIVHGYRICNLPLQPDSGPPVPPAEQLGLAFDREYRFHAASVTVTSVKDEGVSMSVQFADGRVA